MRGSETFHRLIERTRGVRMRVPHGRAVALVVAAAVIVTGAVLQSHTAQSTPSLLPVPQAAAHYTPLGCHNPPKDAGGAPQARCFATAWTANSEHRITPDADGPPATARTPAEIRDAYNVPDGGDGQTVAIVDAFGDSHAEADLGVFRSQFGLPPCTRTNGCLRIIDQRGGTDLPADNSGWATETALDLDAVSTTCPACHILLVQADSPSIDDLGTAVETAASMGVVAVSNSYGLSPEDPTETDFDHYFDHKGVAMVFSSGDDGAVTNWPASNPTVTAVGGTALVQDASSARGWTETVWGANQDGQPGAGSGCSPYEPHPSFQDGYQTGCDGRATADVAADADPQTGLAVYDTVGSGGWVQVGGTSLAAPLVAGMYALAGKPAPDTYPVFNAYHDGNQSADLFDVTQGANGACGTLLCQAGPGWDGPTGLGTPNGVKALTGGPHGKVSGRVTAADTGAPIAGATVSSDPGHYVTTTDTDGKYTLDGVLAGDHNVTVSGAYGFQDTAADVTVDADATTTQDFALATIPRQTVTGTITAGDGTPWPQYAKVSWSDGAGHNGSTFTTPATGKYTLDLVEKSDYTLTVTPAYAGYQSGTAKVSVGTESLTKDITVGVDTLACSAVGYKPVLSGGTAQSFDGGRAPRGWTVTNNDRHYPGYTNQPGWRFDDPGRRANHTGASTGFAVVDSDQAGRGHYQDTALVSPVIDLSEVTAPAVQFATDLVPAVNSTATVDLSTDGGRTWTTVWTDRAFPGRPGPGTVAVPLPAAAGRSQARVRFHYTGELSKWWAIDDVFVGNRGCTQQDGALLVGQVRASDGKGIDGAVVASVTNPGERTTTIATSGDDAVGGGLYRLFTTATGQQQFTASAGGFATATETATVTTGQVTSLDFTPTPASQ